MSDGLGGSRARWGSSLVCFVLVIAWGIAALFFAIVGLRTTRDFTHAAGGAALVSTITTVRAALITAAYSLGGAAAALGLTALVLPREQRPPIMRLAVVWAITTVALIAVRRVSGWPLVIAALVAFLIAADASRRLGRAGWRALRAPNRAARDARA